MTETGFVIMGLFVILWVAAIFWCNRDEKRERRLTNAELAATLRAPRTVRTTTIVREGKITHIRQISETRAPIIREPWPCPSGWEKEAKAKLTVSRVGGKRREKVADPSVGSAV